MRPHNQGGILIQTDRTWLTMESTTITALKFRNHWPWEVILVVEFGFTGVIVVALPTIELTVRDIASVILPCRGFMLTFVYRQYAVDSYKPIVDQILVSVTVFKIVFCVSHSFIECSCANGGSTG